jgi:hypothetical protein
MAYLQVSPLGGSRDETWGGQERKKKRSVSGICQNWVNCDGATEVLDHVPHRTTYRPNNSWVVQQSGCLCAAKRTHQPGPSETIQRVRETFVRSPHKSPRVDISNTCKVGQKLGVSLPLLTCSPSAWPFRLLYCRGRKSRRDLWITLYLG